MTPVELHIMVTVENVIIMWEFISIPWGLLTNEVDHAPHSFHKLANSKTCMSDKFVEQE